MKHPTHVGRPSPTSTGGGDRLETQPADEVTANGGDRKQVKTWTEDGSCRA